MKIIWVIYFDPESARKYEFGLRTEEAVCIYLTSTKDFFLLFKQYYYWKINTGVISINSYHFDVIIIHLIIEFLLLAENNLDVHI